MKPIDVQRSRFECELEAEEDGTLSLRMGLRYVRGLRESVAQSMVHTRVRHGSFGSTQDLTCRVPCINRKEMVQLARIGALNWVGGVEHRRDALWQVEEACRSAGPLLQAATEEGASPMKNPLRAMDTQERVVADYSGSGLTVGPHPMCFRREELRRKRVLSAAELRMAGNGSFVRTAGSVIARQRPGTAMGFIFLSMEDETGIANIIVNPQLYERERVTVTRGRFLIVEGKLQNEDGVVHVRADTVSVLDMGAVEVRSHDFH